MCASGRKFIARETRASLRSRLFGFQRCPIEASTKKPISESASPHTQCVITSLSPRKADAKRLMQLIREHWAAIENRTHWVRDVALGEDACGIFRGQAPHNLAALRNAALNWLRSEHLEKITASLRHFARNPQRLLAKLGIMK